MKLIQATFHPGVLPPDPTIRLRYQRGPHLQMGDLSGACGLYSIFIALGCLGVASMRELGAVPRFNAAVLQDTWAAGCEYFFAGADVEEMLKVLQPLERHVEVSTCLGPMRDQTMFVADRLRRGEVVLLGLEGSDGKDGHWTVAAGIEEQVSKAKRRATGLLCLDPAEAGPGHIARANARLEINVPHPLAKFARYVTQGGGSRSVTIEASLSIRRRKRVFEGTR